VFHRSLAFPILSLTLLCAAGCGNSPAEESADGRGGSGDPGEGGEAGSSNALEDAYLFASSVAGVDDAATYVVVLSELGGTVDISKGLEVGGYPAVFAELGWVFIADSERLVVTRYEVDDRNQLVKPKEMSLVGEGVTSLDGLGFYVFDSERAYYVDSSGSQIIVWNPTSMKIEDAAPIIDLHRNGFDGRAVGGDRPSTWLVKERGELYLPVSWHDYDTLTAEPSVGLLRISASDVRDQSLHTNNCAAMSDEGLMLGLDGNIYLAGTNGWTLYGRFGNPSNLPETGIAKFDLKSQAFDDEYCQSIPELTGGHDAGTVIAFAPGHFLLRAVDDSLAEIGDAGSFYGDIERACRFYHGTIDEEGNLTVQEEPALSATPNYCWGWVYDIDGEPYFWGEDTMFRWDGSALVPVFKSTGFASGFQRIR
jgi:hypothetical protein